MIGCGLGLLQASRPVTAVTARSWINTLSVSCAIEECRFRKGAGRRAGLSRRVQSSLMVNEMR